MQRSTENIESGDQSPHSKVWPFLAVAAWSAFGVALVVKCVAVPGEHSVFPCFARATHNWWADQTLYDNAETPPGAKTGYRYSPAFAIAFTPFVWLPNGVGSAAWCLFSLGVLWWSLRLMRRDLLPDWTERQEAWFLLLALAGSVRGLWAAQSNALVWALAAVAAVAIHRQKWWGAAFLLAGAVYIKVWPIAVAMLLMACWPRALIGRFVAACGVLTLAPFLTRPPATVWDQYSGWYGFLSGVGQIRWAAYRDAWTIWEHLVSPIDPRVYMLVQLATAAGALGIVLWVKRRSSVPQHLLTVLTVWVGWQLLFGPGTERNTYGLSAGVMAWAVVESHRSGRLRVLSSVAWWLNFLFTASGLLERTLQHFVPFSQAFVPVGTVLLIVWVLLFHATGRAADDQTHGDATGGDAAHSDVEGRNAA